MQLWNPEDPQMSSRIIEKINSILMKAVDTFFPKRLLVQSERHPWIDNEVKNAAAKKRRLRQEISNIKITDARNKYSYQNKIVKKLIIRKKRKYYQNKLILESNCKTKTFFETFKEMSGKGKNSKSLNLSKGTLSILTNTLLILVTPQTIDQFRFFQFWAKFLSV